MIYKYALQEKELNLKDCITHHSGDKTVIYKTVGKVPIYMSYYSPTDYNTNGKYPTFIFIHGGAWDSRKVFEEQQNWQGDYLGFLARYYSKQGYIGISIDYRMMRKQGQEEGYQLIDLYDDCTDAVNYILDHAAEDGVDTENVFLLGESAGGHLAGLVATKFKRQGFQFKAAFLVNPITDLEGDAYWRERVPCKSQHPELRKLPQSEYARYLSPLYNIDENTCPIVLMHGTADGVVKPAHSESFYQRMLKYARECDLHWIENTGHAFLIAEYTDNLSACAIGIEILDRYLRGRKHV